jgi:hypothetical protein
MLRYVRTTRFTDTHDARTADQARSFLCREIVELDRKLERDIDRVTQAVLKGVLQRIMQIVESGGQIGTDSKERLDRHNPHTSPEIAPHDRQGPVASEALMSERA